jgi:hypothetical protein
MFVLCVLYSKDKRHSQDNQDKEVVQMKYREQKKNSPVVLLGIFSEATDGTMCPGVDSASKNEYQETPGGKGGRCVRVTTLPPLGFPRAFLGL